MEPASRITLMTQKFIRLEFSTQDSNILFLPALRKVKYVLLYGIYAFRRTRELISSGPDGLSLLPLPIA